MNTLMREILTPLRIVYKYATRKKYREYLQMLKYGQASRFNRTHINLRGIEFDVPDAPSFFSTYKELLYDEIYKFNSNNEKPVILDFGANIGLSVYFFEQNYPKAEIYAYEADPNIFEYLRINVSKFKNANIHLFNEAVCDKNGEFMFFLEGGDGGHLDDCIDDRSHVSVRAIDALDIMKLHEHIDMLKIDIEGAERIVLPRISSELHKVDNVFIEYHSEVDREQCLDSIVSILHDSGFRIYIKPGLCADKPLTETACNNNFDLQLDIFAKRNF